MLNQQQRQRQATKENEAKKKERSCRAYEDNKCVSFTGKSKPRLFLFRGLKMGIDMSLNKLSDYLFGFPSTRYYDDDDQRQVATLESFN